ncbi:hypothetical protein HHE92_05300 [Pseudoalteromonas arctica]|uniref:ATP-grasp domain-containing protein n=1 Tax=Pseudoalteromonas arctica TaxID=394751 RepID=A0AAP6Y1V6_9GAMM|nr:MULTISPECIES: sugar-transfer associated ATP-grasp domain-containing protein [Pseudoalteromonas]MDN3473544.1 sugar-transfer associated ATP-grasp domain-containing protein [Pseudoalteromonas sp. APC 3355]NMP01243.1 hypothetical protein [Pseudoalteromonas arctica]NMP79212.1 hypothetical protein [Pseudoalteromonas arctica]
MKMLQLLKHTVMEKIRCLYLIKFNYRYKANMQRFKQSTDKKDIAVIKSEIKALKKYWGCFPLQYFNHDFYSANCTLTIDEMKQFIPSYYFYKIIFPQYDNSKALLNIVEDKIVMDVLFDGMNFPTANVIAKKKTRYIFNSKGIALNNDSFAELLSSSHSAKLFIKPANGRGGSGILIAKKQDDVYKIKGSDLELNFDYVSKLKGDFVIEEAISQHLDIEAVYAHSVNTLRVITKRNTQGQVEIIATTLRMGSKGSEIDNTSAGGLVIGIDLLTGHAFRDYATHEYGSSRFYEHPDSGFKFKDLIIPNWLNIQNEILELANKNIILNLTGWDIAITNNGIVVIEINTLFGIDGLQSALGGLKNKFMENYTVKL